jgi:hypothetical protein
VQVVMAAKQWDKAEEVLGGGVGGWGGGVGGGGGGCSHADISGHTSFSLSNQFKADTPNHPCGCTDLWRLGVS